MCMYPCPASVVVMEMMDELAEVRSLSMFNLHKGAWETPTDETRRAHDRVGT